MTTSIHATQQPALAQSICERNHQLMRSAVRAAEQRFDASLGLVICDEPDLGRVGGHVAQESLEYAVALAETGGDAERVRTIVRTTLAYQDCDRQSMTYGNWRWMHNWHDVGDVNAVSFMTPNYWRLLSRHRALLGDDLAEQVIAALARAGEALLAHRCQWAYGNIFLLNMLSKLQIARLTDDRRLRSIAYWEYQEWLSYTNQFGIVEFNSPNYTAVHISALEGLLEICEPPAMRRSVEVMLELYYTDLFSHLHPGTCRFAGVKSRQPDAQLRDVGGYVYALLYRQTGKGSYVDSPYNVMLALSDYAAPSAVRALAFDRPLPSTVSSTSPHHALTRDSYITDRYALSTMSGGRYGASDVPLELLYGSPSQVCCATLRGNPHVFTLFSQQQAGWVAGALRWRFRPADERKPLPTPVKVLDAKIIGSDGYVPEDYDRVQAALTLAIAPHEPRVWIDDQPWDGAPVTLAASAAVTVRATGVAIGFVGSGACEQRLSWIDDQLAVTFAIDAPQCEPWMRSHPFMMLVEAVDDDDAWDRFAQTWRSATLACSSMRRREHIVGEVGGERIRLEVPLEPVYLFRAGDFALPQGRLTAAAWRDPALPLSHLF